MLRHGYQACRLSVSLPSPRKCAQVDSANEFEKTGFKTPVAAVTPALHAAMSRSKELTVSPKQQKSCGSAQR